MKFPNNLKYWRLKRKKTQVYIAELLQRAGEKHACKQMIWKIEQGGRRLTTKEAIVICKDLGCSLEDLLGDIPVYTDSHKSRAPGVASSSYKGNWVLPDAGSPLDEATAIMKAYAEAMRRASPAARRIVEAALRDVKIEDAVPDTEVEMESGYVPRNPGSGSGRPKKSASASKTKKSATKKTRKSKKS
ncbi:MAG: hypothetical protein OXT65_06410 [Alphaproteobacteria bacterium]|nr:hypothetical protein [Alphaproteobacteria bacterium]